jgi:hypothetical protein
MYKFFIFFLLVYMAIKQFFRKLGSDTKQFFKPKGTLATAFRKGGIIEKGVNQAGAALDQTLKTVGNVAGKVGGVAGALAPGLFAINPLLGEGAMALGGLAAAAGKGTQQLKDLKVEGQKGYKGGIEAMKPPPAPMEDNMNFA